MENWKPSHSTHMSFHRNHTHQKPGLVHKRREIKEISTQEVKKYWVRGKTGLKIILFPFVYTMESNKCQLINPFTNWKCLFKFCGVFGLHSGYSFIVVKISPILVMLGSKENYGIQFSLYAM
ncbi:hypothetical protein STEG23_007063 [Scotinomys teguina]